MPTLRSLLTASPLLLAVGAFALADAAGADAAPRIAFTSDRAPDRSIYTMNPDGSDVRLAVEGRRPGWNVDGTRLTFTRRAGRPGVYSLFTAAPDGSAVAQLTAPTGDPLSAAGDYDAAFSPDGRRMAFTRFDGLWSIYLAGADGSAPVKLTSLGNNHSPSFSPDGSRIAFSSDRAGTTQVFVMDADGGAQTQLTHQGENLYPAWSPAHDQIAFSSNRTGNREIFVMDGRGGGQAPRTSVPADDTEPAWSSDGRRLAFVSQRDGGDREVYTMNADGSAQTRITTSPGIDHQPRWQPVPPAAAEMVTGFPATGACRRARAMTLRLTPRAVAHVRSVSVTVNGRAMAKRSALGDLLEPMRLAKLPRTGRYTVKVALTTAAPAPQVVSKRYHACARR